HAATVVALTALGFAFLPRDFRREGLVGDDALGGLVRRSTTGFAERIDLDRSVHATISDRVVLRVRPVDGNVARVSPLWRGAVLEWYDARGWRTVTRPRE